MIYVERLLFVILVLVCLSLAPPATALPGSCFDRIAGKSPGGLSGPTSVGGTIAEDQRERKEVSGVPFFDEALAPYFEWKLIVLIFAGYSSRARLDLKPKMF